MGESSTPTPDRHQPHAFEPTPEVPIVPTGTGIMLEPGMTVEGTGSAGLTASKCALCGAPRGDRIHVEGEAEADAESPHWGL